ncbi:hypothetical protein D1P53_003594 [Cryptococcus gattii VGV]|nr:hypothetical protein D1P53_003594 [Cryptococcus gattii VGV]
MDIFSRLNPFHRPNSAMSRNTPTPFSVGARPSSSLENGNVYPTPEATPNPSVEVYCHGGQLRHYKPTCNGETPTMPKDSHRRSQSLLRNLAHHSSLSALTSKSTRGKKKGKKMKGIHLMPDSSHPYGDGGDGGDGSDAKDSEVQRRLIPTFGTGKLKKGTLKPSKSLPRDLRLSEEFQLPNDLPPLPSSTEHDVLNKSQASVVTFRPGNVSPFKSQRTCLRGNSVTPTPEITVYHDCSGTPESVKLRMRFDLDWTSTYSGSPSRRRHNSFDERASHVDPLTPRAQSIRHRSSPPKASSSTTSHDFTYLQTQQHPHPVPRIQEERILAHSLYADSTTFFGPDDILPITESGNTIFNEEPEPLDMFKRGEELNEGKLVGSKSDLLKGIFVDGRKRSKDPEGVDLYASPSASSESTYNSHFAHHLSPKRSSPAHRRAESSPSPGRKPRDTFSKAAKRSSSPFEIKLSPHVTRRMSLDAFGTPTTDPLFNSHNKGDKIEEITDVDESYESRNWHQAEEARAGKPPSQTYDTNQDELFSSDEQPLATFRGTELSTIMESSSSRGNESQCMSSEIGRDSPMQSHGSLPRPSWDPFSSSEWQQPFTPKLTADGLPMPNSISPASPLLHKKYTSAPPLVGVSPRLLDAHLEHSQSLKDQISASSVIMEVLKSEVAETKKRLADEARERDELIEFAEGRVMDLEEAKRQCDAKDQALEQLRQAMTAKEHMVEELREAKLFYEERCDSLERENDALLANKEETIQLCIEMETENDELKRGLSKIQDENDKFQREKKEAEVDIQALQTEMRFIESKVSNLEDVEGLLRDTEAEVFELRRGGERLLELEKQLENRDEKMTERDRTIQALRKSLDSARLESLNRVKAATEELMASVQLVSDKEEIIFDLTSKLSTHEEYSQSTMLALTAKEEEVNELTSKIKSISEKQREDEEMLLKLRNQLETLEAERKARDSEANERLLKYAEEMEAWNEERKELRMKVSDLSVQATSASSECDKHKLVLIQKEQTIDELTEMLRLIEFESDERHFESQEAIHRLKSQIEEQSKNAAEIEMGSVQTSRLLASYEEGKRLWEEEKEELYERLTQHMEETGNVVDLQAEIEGLFFQLQVVKDECEVHKASAAQKSDLIRSRDAELAKLRHTIKEIEKSTAEARTAIDRRAKGYEREVANLHEQVEELKQQLSHNNSALRSAVLEAESGKVLSQDTKWRVDRYLTEIDELKLGETKLRSHVEQLRMELAMDEFKRIELERKVTKLEQDKELLNVALESKQTEVALLQRKEKHRSVASPSFSSAKVSHSSQLSVSTSRILATPTSGTGVNNAPPTFRLATSIRKDMTAPKLNPASRLPLGASIRDNTVSDGSRVIPTKAAREAEYARKKVARRTSLPTLARPQSAADRKAA